MNFNIELELSISDYSLDEENIRMEMRKFNINKVLFSEKLKELTTDELRLIVNSNIFIIGEEEYVILETKVKLSTEDHLTYYIRLSLKNENDDYMY